jgi:hypothetical protein
MRRRNRRWVSTPSMRRGGMSPAPSATRRRVDAHSHASEQIAKRNFMSAHDTPNYSTACTNDDHTGMGDQCAESDVSLLSPSWLGPLCAAYGRVSSRSRYAWRARVLSVTHRQAENHDQVIMSTHATLTVCEHNAPDPNPRASRVQAHVRVENSLPRSRKFERSTFCLNCAAICILIEIQFAESSNP